MKAEEFNQMVKKTIDKCTRTLVKKAEHYAGDEDRLENFVRAAKLQDTTPADACFSMLSKHLVSVAMMLEMDDLPPMKQWDEKIVDAINYLILLRGCLVDMGVE